MKHKTQTFTGYRTLLSVALTIATISSPAFANNDNIITLIEMGDLHGTLVPHAAIMKNPDGSEYKAASSGGLARLKTVVNTIRADNPEAVLLSTGDLTHGSTETMFTVGDAMMMQKNLPVRLHHLRLAQQRTQPMALMLCGTGAYRHLTPLTVIYGTCLTQ